jgi:uncharacterized membrane protein HdeD (DUF308 family)
VCFAIRRRSTECSPRSRRSGSSWWLQLVGGIIELVLGFWAAGFYGRSATLLIAWVAAFTIIRGIRDIVMAFRVNAIKYEL